MWCGVGKVRLGPAAGTSARGKSAGLFPWPIGSKLGRIVTHRIGDMAIDMFLDPQPQPLGSPGCIIP